GDSNLSDHLDVVNMSLGSNYGVDIADTGSEIEAVNNAALVGMISVSAAGNAGDTTFIASAPGAAKAGIMAAASQDDSQHVVYVHESSPNVNDYAGQPSAFNNPSGTPPPAPGGQSANIVYANDTAGGAHKGCGTGAASDPLAFSNAAAISGNIV